ncbi:hypothetical protein GE09DRAFT_1231124 [Coniochaeta sp. 2T2.1]|nr:hypothetical protein GE09DRAFT_1231124 [Coniochaeta sp. 2T2.1]
MSSANGDSDHRSAPSGSSPDPGSGETTLVPAGNMSGHPSAGVSRSASGNTSPNQSTTGNAHTVLTSASSDAEREQDTAPKYTTADSDTEQLALELSSLSIIEKRHPEQVMRHLLRLYDSRKPFVTQGLLRDIVEQLDALDGRDGETVVTDLTGAEGGPIRCFLQDVLRGEAFGRCLEEKGIALVDDPEGYLEFDEETVVVALDPIQPVRQITADITRPAMMIWPKYKEDYKADVTEYCTDVITRPTNPRIRPVFTFPKNTFIENIAVRPNSDLLLTSLSVPDLYSINPKAPAPTASVIYTFPNATGLSGIAEVSPDVYAVVTGTWDLANTRAALGSLQVWTVDLSDSNNGKDKVVVERLANIANSTIFNGIARHPTNPALLLAADSALGAVWRVDLRTGAYGVAFSSTLLAPTGTAPGTNLGINGLKARGMYLYFTNSARRFFGRVKIDSQGGAAGPVEIISSSSKAGEDVIYDDIALQDNGDAWIASHPSYAVLVKKDGTQRVVNDTDLLLNPTAAAFGRGSREEEKTLYVTNGGEFAGADLVNGGVVAIGHGH